MHLRPIPPSLQLRPCAKRLAPLHPLLLALLVHGVFQAGAQAPEPVHRPGLKVRFQVGREISRTVSPNAWLHVPAGESADPFLPPGPIQAVWEGFLHVDLRDNYYFDAQLRGTATVTLGDKVVYEAASDGIQTPERSPRVRLSKGPNPVRIEFRGPAEGDAWFRLAWKTPDWEPEPIPSDTLSHAPDPELDRDLLRHEGRGVAASFRCFQCHDPGVEGPGMAELIKDAPTFDGIGARRSPAFLAEWIADPMAHRSQARMPVMLHGTEATRDALAMVAYLRTLKGGTPVQAIAADPTKKETGEKLFVNLHCIACHNPPVPTESDPAKISLDHVNGKFPAGMLGGFLSAPGRHYAWTRMPDFKLTPEEAAALAGFLQPTAPKPGDRATPDPGDLDRGRTLVATKGCLNCHTAPVENRHIAPAWNTLKNWAAGCLSPTRPASPAGAPHFPQLSARQREAVQAFAAQPSGSAGRHVRAEFAERQTQELNCRNCHGRFEGFPKLEGLGDKLKPEWSARLLAGRMDFKPRPWITGRMPAFPVYAENLARGLTQIHGLPQVSPSEPPIDPEKAKVGRKLIGSDGGFSCIACHAVGEFGATQVFESAGINFAYTAERLQRDFFERWLLNPLRFDPQTKMPDYFDQEQSLLYDYYDGNARQQIDALWHYLRQGRDIPPPPAAD